MILQIEDWTFDVDVGKTMEYSAAEAAEHCDCGYCRNYYRAVDSVFPGLRPFLARFGVDVEAPDTLYPYDLQKDRMWYEGEYAVFGRILRAGENAVYNGETGQMQIIPIPVDSGEPSSFVLSIEGAELPWLLDEHMQDVVSPANEPDFQQQMWDNLLNKAQTDIIT